MKLLADDSPISVDWEGWFNAKTKFDKRNARFAVRVTEEA